MAGAKLTISSRNYSSWSLRAWLFCQLAELEVEVESVPMDDANNRAELLLLSPTVMTPRLDHNGASIWDTFAIAEYLEEEFPDKGLLPLDKRPRSHARSIMGEMHGGFYNMRSALPMNIRARYPGFRVFTGAKGRYVPLKETIRGFKAIVAGEYDHLPEQAFYMVGTIEEAIEKAKKMQ